MNLYDAVTFLMLIGIGALVGYVIWFVDPISPLICAAQGGTNCAPAVNPLTTPGGEQSFGFALALMFLMAALIFHIVDRTYRVWPFGRRVTPPAPGPITTDSTARFLRIALVLAAAGTCSYLLGNLVLT
jgi:flagellar biosynthesis protein FliR